MRKFAPNFEIIMADLLKTEQQFKDVMSECRTLFEKKLHEWRHWRSAWGMNTDGRWRWMQNGEKGFEPVWCPFYREDSGRSIYCEGITDESFLRLTFASGRAKRQQMEIFCRTKNCEKCELYTAINARYADD